MTMDEARNLVLNAQARLLQIRQEVHQIETRLIAVENVLELLVQRLAPPEAEDDDGTP